jgi:hypothetical protein
MNEGTEGRNAQGANLVLRPELWPLPHREYEAFAIVGSLRFGWVQRNFHIVRDGLTWTRTLHKFPLSEDGWALAWQTLASQYPQLAASVSQKVADTRHVALEADRVLQANAEGKRALEQLGTYAELSGATLLGGYGWDEPRFVPGTECSLRFTHEGIWVHPTNGWAALLRSPYTDALALEFSGPGAVTTSGGFFGGGFGVKGAAEGMIVGSVLNALTTRTTIHTVIRYQAVNLEAFFFYSKATPNHLRVQLSQVLSFIRPTTGSSTGPGPAAELEKLAELHKAGALSDEEFAVLKSKIIANL